MNLQDMIDVAQAIVAPGKGILAADESDSTIQRRFDSIGVESTFENRRDYREGLFRTAGAAEFVSGVILYDETLRQEGADGTPLVEVLSSQGIIPGIKVDKSTKPLAGIDGELITEGLDGLRDRLGEYADLGAKFTKWRAVITIGSGIPTRRCIEANAHALARFATLSQEAGLVPIVEPEVLMDGDHDIDTCYEVTTETLREVYYELGTHRVALEGTLLKPNMVLSGKDASDRANAEQVAEMTVDCFMNTVPAAVPGVVFLSGGQSDDEATVNLDAINRYAASSGAPWELSFSYGRGLQAAPLKAWGGVADNIPAAQAAYYHRAKVTSAARRGEYTAEMEEAADPSARVLVVAAKFAWPEYKQLSAYIHRQSVQPTDYIAFYKDGVIQPLVPRIKSKIKSLNADSRGNAKELLGRLHENPADVRLDVWLSRTTESILFLSEPDHEETINLREPIINDKKNKNGDPTPFTYGTPRYVTLESLVNSRKTSELELYKPAK